MTSNELLALKVVGKKDKWSNMKIDLLRAHCKCNEDDLSANVLRWHLRGLSIIDAKRKVEIQKAITINSRKKAAHIRACWNDIA